MHLERIFISVWKESVFCVSWWCDRVIKPCWRTSSACSRILMQFYKCYYFSKIIKIWMFLYVGTYPDHVFKPEKLRTKSCAINLLKEAATLNKERNLFSSPGLCSVYRRFVESFRQIASSRNKVLQKRSPKSFEISTLDQLPSIQAVIVALTSASILLLYQSNLLYFLDTNASVYHIECILFGTNSYNVGCPIE